jgi:MazG family protein
VTAVDPHRQRAIEMTDNSLDPLVQLVTRLRDPDGCPWDREQTLTTVRAYLIEEAHEVGAAIDQGDVASVSAELGDLLFQLVFTVLLAEEAGGLKLDAVIESIRRKMIERHPHVFGDATLANSDEVRQAWEKRKARANEDGQSILDGVPTSLPALLGSYRMTQKAAGVGFDWPDAKGVLAKVREELEELEAELDAEAADQGKVAEELGDLLFAIGNLGRHLGVDPEGALARANEKFRRRFRLVERRLEDDGRRVEETPLEELDSLWNDVKREERSGSD